jgi:large subunit ribosomal protein L16
MIQRPVYKGKYFAKFRKSRLKGIRQPVALNGNAVVGLYTCQNVKITSSTLWSLFRHIRLEVSRKVGVRLVAFPSVGLTKKPSEVRMGKGRGSISTFVCRLKSGSIIYELSHIDPIFGVFVLKKIQKYLGFGSRIFVRKYPGVDIKGSTLRFLFIFLFFFFN